MKYRSKPVEIEAVEWKGTDESWREVCDLVGDSEDVIFRNPDETLAIETLEGRMRANVGDFIARDSDGDIWRIPRRNFLAMYEVVP